MTDPFPRRDAAYLFSAFSDLPAAFSWRLGAAWVAAAMLIAGLTIAAIAAHPAAHSVEPATQSNDGRIIQIVLDRSGSMERDDMRSGTERVSRLVSAKETIGTLLDRRDPRDRIGLITFAGRVRIDAVATADRDAIRRRLAAVEPTRRFRDDGTAIGDALTAAAESFSGQPAPSRGGPPRVLVLMTDGQQNAGSIDLASAIGRVESVEAIAIAVQIRPPDPKGESYRRADVAESDRLLSSLAERTGGASLVAADVAALRSALDALDRLPTRPIAEPSQPTKRWWATEGLRVGSIPLPPLLPVAAAMVGVSILLRRTVAIVRPD